MNAIIYFISQKRLMGSMRFSVFRMNYSIIILNCVSNTNANQLPLIFSIITTTVIQGHYQNLNQTTLVTDIADCLANWEYSTQRVMKVKMDICHIFLIVNLIIIIKEYVQSFSCYIVVIIVDYQIKPRVVHYSVTYSYQDYVYTSNFFNHASHCVKCGKNHL